MPRVVEGGLRDAGLLAGRCLLVFIFLHEGFGILGNYAGAAGYMQKSGVPSLLLPAVIAAVDYGVIRREEEYLERKFGDDYRLYKAHVRRWM